MVSITERIYVMTVHVHNPARYGIGYKAYEFTFPFFPVDGDIEWVLDRVTLHAGDEARLFMLRNKETTWSSVTS